MANKFKLGDVVVLKSGGPDMTVNDLPNKYRSTYGCQWFAGKKLESGFFDEAALSKRETPSTP